MSIYFLLCPFSNVQLRRALFIKCNDIYCRFDPPLELREGDEIKTICTYKTTSKDETTYFGEATSVSICKNIKLCRLYTINKTQENLWHLIIGNNTVVCLTVYSTSNCTLFLNK